MKRFFSSLIAILLCSIVMAQTKAGASTEFTYGAFTLDRNRVMQCLQTNTDTYMKMKHFNKKERALFMETFGCVMESLAIGRGSMGYDSSLTIELVKQPSDPSYIGWVVHFINEICKGLVQRGEYIKDKK